MVQIGDEISNEKLFSVWAFLSVSAKWETRKSAPEKIDNTSSHTEQFSVTILGNNEVISIAKIFETIILKDKLNPLKYNFFYLESKLGKKFFCSLQTKYDKHSRTEKNISFMKNCKI